MLSRQTFTRVFSFVLAFRHSQRYYLKWASSESPEDDKKNDQAAQSAISLHKSLGKFFQFLGICERTGPVFFSWFLFNLQLLASAHISSM